MITDNPPLVLEALRSIGPLAAVVTALYIASRAERREKRDKPDLSLAYDHHRGEDFAIGLLLKHAQVPKITAEEHWVRVRVVNRAGKRTAEDVEVTLLDFRHIDTGANQGTQPMGDLAFPWVNRFDGDKPAVKVTIPPGAARRFELLRLREPLGLVTAKTGVTDTHAVLSVVPTPGDERHFIAKGRYTILLAVTAKDTDARYFAFHIAFDGKWSTGPESRRRLVVEGPSAAFYEALHHGAPPEEQLTVRRRLSYCFARFKYAADPRYWLGRRRGRILMRESGEPVVVGKWGRARTLHDVRSEADTEPGEGGAPDSR
jgi:hypothetical protein